MAVTSAAVALSDLAAAQRHRHLLEALFTPSADPTLFVALDAGPPALEATARPVALAAFAGASIAHPDNTVDVAVCGVTFRFLVLKHNLSNDDDLLHFADSVAAVTLVIPTPAALWRKLRPALHATAAEVASAMMAVAAGETASASLANAPSTTAATAAAASVLESLVRPAVAPPVTVVAGRDPTARVAAAVDAVRWIQRQCVARQQQQQQQKSKSKSKQPASDRAPAAALVTRTIRLATIFALAERRGGVGDEAAAAWSRLRSALEEAVCGFPFVGSAESRRRRQAAAARREEGEGPEAPPQRLTATLVILEDAELLDGSSAAATVMQARLVTASLRRWLLALRRDPVAVDASPLPPFALLAVAATDDAGGTRLHATLTSPGLCNTHIVVPAAIADAASRAPPDVVASAAEGPRAPLAAAGGGFSGLMGVGAVTAAVERALLQPLRLARDAPIEAMGLRVPKGALITGPSGCGKTALLAALFRVLNNVNNDSDGPTLAKTMGGAARAVLVDAQSLIRKEVGASEKNVSRVFAEARAMSPCVLLIDGLDAIARPRGGGGGSEADSAGDRVLSTLLIEMDGIAASSRAGAGALAPAVGSQQQQQTKRATVVVVATATSAADLDPAVRRSGRLDVHLQLGRPDAAAALGIIQASFAAAVPQHGGHQGDPQELFARAAQWGISGGAWASHADVVGFCREVAADAVRTLSTTGTGKKSRSAGGDDAALAAAVGAAMQRRLVV